MRPCQWLCIARWSHYLYRLPVQRSARAARALPFVIARPPMHPMHPCIQCINAYICMHAFNASGSVIGGACMGLQTQCGDHCMMAGCTKQITQSCAHHQATKGMSWLLTKRFCSQFCLHVFLVDVCFEFCLIQWFVVLCSHCMLSVVLPCCCLACIVQLLQVPFYATTCYCSSHCWSKLLPIVACLHIHPALHVLPVRCVLLLVHSIQATFCSRHIFLECLEAHII